MRFGIGIAAAAALGLVSVAFAQEAVTDKEINEAVARVAAVCGNHAFEALPREQQVSYMTCMQREAAAMFKARTPMRIDEYTTATDVTSNGTIVTYWMRIELAREELPAGVLEEINLATRQNVCGDADMAATIRRGGGYRYVWSDRSGEGLGEVTIERC